MDSIHQHQFDNGLIMLVEPVAGVRSVGLSFLLPAGCCRESSDQQGVAGLLSEMMYRGAGGLTSREHSESLDILGVERYTDAQTYQMRIGATLLGDQLDAALPLLMNMGIRPTLADEAFEVAREIGLQMHEALEDDPHQKVILETKRRHTPQPFGRSALGVKELLRDKITVDDVRSFFAKQCVPGGSILSFAGNVDFEHLKEAVGRIIEGWEGGTKEPTADPKPERGYHHITMDQAQTHIALAYDTVGDSHPDRMVQNVAIGILSGGMSGRLFTEVREKRGLCYSVYASYAAFRDMGTIYAYAGTTPERAAETLSVINQEIGRLAEGVNEDEFQRSVIGLKSRLVMQGESTSARASAIARDQLIVGRPETLDELQAEIESVTLDRVNRFVAEHLAADMTTVTIGPQPLM